MSKVTSPPRVLAIDPTPRGFGYAILEGSTGLIDWGVKSVRCKSIEKEIETVSKITDLIQHYLPQYLILEKPNAKGSRRCGRVRLLLGTLQNVAVWQGIESRTISPEKLRKVFCTFGCNTKLQIANFVAQQFPGLADQLPEFRKPWMSEDYHMPIFDAVALALTYYYTRGIRNLTRKAPADSQSGVPLEGEIA
jgi:Holliday junction resolvasome RuvABC endonuclease subunit